MLWSPVCCVCFIITVRHQTTLEPTCDLPETTSTANTLSSHAEVSMNAYEATCLSYPFILNVILLYLKFSRLQPSSSRKFWSSSQQLRPEFFTFSCKFWSSFQWPQLEFQLKILNQLSMAVIKEFQLYILKQLSVAQLVSAGNFEAAFNDCN